MIEIVDPEYNAILVLKKFFQHYFMIDDDFHYDPSPEKSRIEIGTSLIAEYSQEIKMISVPRILFTSGGSRIQPISSAAGRGTYATVITPHTTTLAHVQIQGRIDGQNEAQLSLLRGHIVAGMFIYKAIRQFDDCAKELGYMKLQLPLMFSGVTRQGSIYSCSFSLMGIISIHASLEMSTSAILLNKIKILREGEPWTEVTQP